MKSKNSTKSGQSRSSTPLAKVRDPQKAAVITARKPIRFLFFVGSIVAALSLFAAEEKEGKQKKKTSAHDRSQASASGKVSPRPMQPVKAQSTTATPTSKKAERGRKLTDAELLEAVKKLNFDALSGAYTPPPNNGPYGPPYGPQSSATPPGPPKNPPYHDPGGGGGPGRPAKTATGVGQPTATPNSSAAARESDLEKLRKKLDKIDTSTATAPPLGPQGVPGGPKPPHLPPETAKTSSASPSPGPY